MTAPAGLMCEAVTRAGHKCALCGRPCRDADARRHSEPGPFGDGPDNFAALCPACRSFVDGRTPPPARYVVHVWHGPRAWMRRTQRVLIVGYAVAVALASAFYVGLLALVVFATYASEPWRALGCGLLLLLVIAAGRRVVTGRRPPDRVIEMRHAHDPTRERTREEYP